MPDDLLPASFFGDAVWTDDELDVVARAENGDPLDDDVDVLPYYQRELTGREHASWAMAEVARLERGRADLADQAIAWKARIDAWYRDLDRPMSGRQAFLVDRLKRYAIATRELDGSASLHLPSGDITTRRAKQPSIVLDDTNDVAESLVLTWASETFGEDDYDDVVKTVTSLRISELRKRCVIVTVGGGDDVRRLVVLAGTVHVGEDGTPFDSDGEPIDNIDAFVVPGVAIEDPETTATVKPLATTPALPS